MSKKKQLNPIIVAGDGERYRLVVMRVQDVYEDKPEVSGMKVPAELLFVDDDDTIEISGGERFVTAYVPESVFGKPPVKPPSSKPRR